MQLASEDKKWKTLEKEREKLVFVLIITLLGLLIIFTLISIVIFNLDNYAIIAFLSALIYLFPGYLILKKINRVSEKIDLEKEILVLDLFNLDLSVKEIELKSGIPDNFINYYLKKNELNK